MNPINVFFMGPYCWEKSNMIEAVRSRVKMKVCCEMQHAQQITWNIDSCCDLTGLEKHFMEQYQEAVVKLLQCMRSSTSDTIFRGSIEHIVHLQCFNTVVFNQVKGSDEFAEVVERSVHGLTFLFDWKMDAVDFADPSKDYQFSQRVVQTAINFFTEKNISFVKVEGVSFEERVNFIVNEIGKRRIDLIVNP